MTIMEALEKWPGQTLIGTGDGGYRPISDDTAGTNLSARTYIASRMEDVSMIRTDDIESWLRDTNQSYGLDLPPQYVPCILDPSHTAEIGEDGDSYFCVACDEGFRALESPHARLSLALAASPWR